MFGELKSKIEVCLTESYKKNKIKDHLFIFEELVLKNKNISKIFFIYDELSSKKELQESLATEFIHESITVYENTLNKIAPIHIKELKMWVGNIKCKNNYQDIDNLFSKNILSLESKIQSKKIILETLKSKKDKKKEVINVPLKSMINVANRTVTKFIESLTESEKKELKTILNIPKEKLIENYNETKLFVLEKLEEQKKNSDNETLKTIDLVMEKIQTESFNELNYYKLKQLKGDL